MGFKEFVYNILEEFVGDDDNDFVYNILEVFEGVEDFFYFSVVFIEELICYILKQFNLNILEKVDDLKFMIELVYDIVEEDIF